MLRGIGKGGVGVGMDFDHEAVVVEQLGCASQWGDEVAAAADVAWVADERHVGQFATESHGNLPERFVAIAVVVVHGKAAVDGADVVDAALAEAFDGAEPESHVGACGVFDQHGHATTAEGGTEFLDHEGVARGTCADPDGTDAIALAEGDMLGLGDLAAVVDAVFGREFLHPAERGLAETLEATRACAWFPDAGAEECDARHGGECGRNLPQLVTALDAARTCYDCLYHILVNC